MQLQKIMDLYVLHVENVYNIDHTLSSEVFCDWLKSVNTQYSTEIIIVESVSCLEKSNAHLIVDIQLSKTLQ